MLLFFFLSSFSFLQLIFPPDTAFLISASTSFFKLGEEGDVLKKDGVCVVYLTKSFLEHFYFQLLEKIKQEGKKDLVTFHSLL